jgi:hypothetical protein
MIPPFGYQNFEERQQKTLRNTCSFVQRSGKKNKSLMKILNLHKLAITLRDACTRLVHESLCKQCTWDDKDTDRY